MLAEFTIFFIFLGGVFTEDPVVNIPHGKIQGFYKNSYGGRKYIAFEGIPYGKPPINELRFKEPIEAEPWEDTIIANTTHVCQQFLASPMFKKVTGDEDCLYLNVYVPKEQINEDDNLDVVVHIHGGAFVIGSPQSFAGALYIMDKDVVYVNFNYRLGILGFLSTEDDVVPGNNGLKDQVLALKWINNNIKYFGGNPNSITLTGLSAGACSVHLHYLSPLSKGLFHRGFSQSGTALQFWALTKKPLEKTKKLAMLLNCTQNTILEMVECLRQKPSKEVVSKMIHFYTFMDCLPFTPFGPVIENIADSFLPEHPYKLLSDGKIYNVPWINSNVKDEGIFPAGYFLLFNKLDEFDKKWNEQIQYALGFNDTVTENEKLNLSKTIRQYYFGKKLLKDDVQSLIAMFTDRVYLNDARIAVKLHAKMSKSPVYYYKFSYELEQPGLFGSSMPGVAHADDGKLLFYIIGGPNVLQENDEMMMKALTNFLVTYAANGIPTFENVTWNPVSSTSDEINYMRIASPKNITMEFNAYFGPTDFWNSLPIQENEKLYQ